MNTRGCGNECCSVNFTDCVFISPDCGIAIRRYPDAGEVIRMYFVLDELTTAIFVHVDAARLTVVYLTVHHSWIGTGLHLKARDSVVVDVISVKVTLKYANNNKLLFFSFGKKKISVKL